MVTVKEIAVVEVPAGSSIGYRFGILMDREIVGLA
jgi:hypothetical protein